MPETETESGIPNVTNPYHWAWQQHLFLPTAVMDTLLEGKLKEHPGGPAGLLQASYLSSSEILSQTQTSTWGLLLPQTHVRENTFSEKAATYSSEQNQSSRCFGHHCDTGVTISDCIHCQSMNHKVADNFTLPRVIGTSLSLLSSGN